MIQKDIRKHRKVCLYLGSYGKEIDAVAAKRHTTRSKLLVEAWERAKSRIQALPGLPKSAL